MKTCTIGKTNIICYDGIVRYKKRKRWGSMRILESLRNRWKSISDTILRFPFTVILVAAAAVMNCIWIHKLDYMIGSSSRNLIYQKLFITLLIGAMVSVVGQLIYERFFQDKKYRDASMGIAFMFSLFYYIMIKDAKKFDTVVFIRTEVIFFLLLILFLWVPVIKNKYHINQSFMAAFKAFFISVLFTGVLFLGVALILRATDRLITRIDSDLYGYAATIIFVLFAPVYFLSMIPYYNQKEDNEEAVAKLTTPSKFLDSLVSYIIIPITLVFTIILILYIIMNITGEFWTNNLMEPLLVSYSLTVIIVYLLACSLNNVITKYFRLIFPKVLILVVLFQTLASALKINEVGVTYGRYYSILFGLFATVASILFSIIPLRKNGMIAPILIVLSLISIVPPVDAFTVSKVVQVSRLKETLVRNDMLKDDTIQAKPDIKDKDKEIITASIIYLDKMNDTKEFAWLNDYSESKNFIKTFGFDLYNNSKENYQTFIASRDPSSPIPVSGDYLFHSNFSTQQADTLIGSFSQDGKEYIIKIAGSKDEKAVVLEENGIKITQVNLSDIYNKFAKSDIYNQLSTKEVTFKGDSKEASITLIADSVNINVNSYNKDLYMDLYIMVDIK